MDILERESGKSLTEPNSICSNLFAYLAILHLRFGRLFMDKSICCVNTLQGNLLGHPSPGSAISVNNQHTYRQSPASRAAQCSLHAFDLRILLSSSPFLLSRRFPCKKATRQKGNWCLSVSCLSLFCDKRASLKKHYRTEGP